VFLESLFYSYLEKCQSDHGCPDFELSMSVCLVDINNLTGGMFNTAYNMHISIIIS
jgi:hypothetical protein